MRRAATRAFIGEHQNISNKNATLRKINSNARLPSNYTEHTEVYSNDTKPSLWRKPLGQIGPIIKLKVRYRQTDRLGILGLGCSLLKSLNLVIESSAKYKNVSGADGPYKRRKRRKLSFKII